MKNLNSYTDKAISKIMADNGAFFAFSNKQFDEKKKEGVKYCSLGAGLVAPKENAKTILNEVEKATDKGIAKDVKENGIKAIIWRELANFESQINMSCEDTINALKYYPITEDEIKAEFKLYMAHCVKHDLF